MSAAAGATAPKHGLHEVFLSAPSRHVCVPALHGRWRSAAPWVSQSRFVPTVHGQTLSIRLSGKPSQSASRVELQSRVVFAIEPTHSAFHRPAVHVWTPCLHNPAAAGPHACVSPSIHGHPSLGVPLQEASSPLMHESWAAGATLHVCHRLSDQVCEPLAQLPNAPGQARRSPATHSAIASTEIAPSNGRPSAVS